MKKVLYSTTALAAAGLLAFSPADAQAQEKIKVNTGGFFVWYAGVGDQEDAFSNNYNVGNMVGDSEVSFSGNTTLDNGIRVDVILQLETDQSTANGGTSVDESYLKIGNLKSWGEFRLGSTKEAQFTFKQEAPAVTDVVNPRNNDQQRFVIRPNNGGALGHLGAGDNMLISYISPNFSGFQAGISYTPSTDNSDALPVGGGGTNAAAASSTQRLTIGGTYKGKFNDVGVAIAAGYAHSNGDASTAAGTNTEGYSVGGNISFAGFTVGANYVDIDDERGDLPTTSTSADSQGLQIGAVYATGPWKVGLNYWNSERPLRASVAGDDEGTSYTLGVSYALGAGITAGASVFMLEFDDETTTASLNNEGWGALAGVKVAF